MSGSTIRTTTETSGKPRRRRWTLRALIAVVMTTGSLVSLAGPAQAYDAKTCDDLPTLTLAMDQFKMGAGRVDFGDGLHLLGAPLEDAVVCWESGGSIMTIGKLYADSLTSINVAYNVKYYRADGSGAITSKRVYFFGRNGESQAVRNSLPGPGGWAFDRVRIQLWLCGVTPSDGTCSLVNAKSFYRTTT